MEYIRINVLCSLSEIQLDKQPEMSDLEHVAGKPLTDSEYCKTRNFDE